MNQRTVAMLLGLSLVPLGCGEECDAPGTPEPPAMRVEVWDAERGWAITTATGSIRSRDGTHPLEGFDSNDYWAYAGPGRYDVTVRADGYRTWTRQNIVVKTGDCGYPITVDLRADLAPAR